MQGGKQWREDITNLFKKYFFYVQSFPLFRLSAQFLPSSPVLSAMG